MHAAPPIMLILAGEPSSITLHATCIMQMAYAQAAYLKELLQAGVYILRWFGNALPHLVEVCLEHLHKLRQRGLGLVTNDEEQHRALAAGIRCEELEVDLHRRAGGREHGDGMLHGLWGLAPDAAHTKAVRRMHV